MALALGRTVGELLQSISYPELLQWGEYYEAEPFGEWRGDVRSANICAVLANVNRDPKARPEPFGVHEFMLFDRKREAAEEETEDMDAAISPDMMAWLFSRGAETRRASG